MSDQDAKMVNDKVHALLKSNKRFNYRACEGRDAVYFKLDDGSEIYVLYRINEIIYNGKLYDMDEQNKSLALQILKKQLRHDIRDEFKGEAGAFLRAVAIGCFVFCIIVGVGYGAGYGIDKVSKKHRINKQVAAYRETLPHWNDSIRLAETDEELANAINRREQVELKVKHYRDSLKRVR